MTNYGSGRLTDTSALRHGLRPLVCCLLLVGVAAVTGCRGREREASVEALTAPLPTATPSPSPSIDPRVTDLERVKEGTPAPDFALEDVSGKVHRLADYRGKQHVILVFYRGHF